jgi:hypothetical protein
MNLGFNILGRDDMAKVWTTYLTNIANAATENQTIGSFELSKIDWSERTSKPFTTLVSDNEFDLGYPVTVIPQNPYKTHIGALSK